jgi:DNA helicase II / ATP-dependent DNA helicase PcrA
VYGTIRLFDPDELAGAALFDLPRAPRKPRAPASDGTASDGTGGTAPIVAEASDAAAPSALAGLDPDQQAIVDHDDGPLLVVAGPGAGKTRVLTHAIARRIGDGLPPEQCLAVTFTRRARDELRERLAVLLGAETAARVTVATFHGLGLLILREQCKLLGLDADLKVADEKSRHVVLRLLSPSGSLTALGARIADSKRVRASSCTAVTATSLTASAAGDGAAEGGAAGGRAAGGRAAGGRAAGDGAAGGGAGRDSELDGLVARYDAALRERGMIDVDDLVTLPVELLGADASLAAAYQSRWTDVFVDEYQDVNEEQYLMLRLLAAPGSRVCAIGDPDQAIYGFRGGDVGYFLRFEEDFGRAVGPMLADPPGTGVTLPGATAETTATAATAATAVRAATAATAATAVRAATTATAATVRLSRSYRSAPTIVRAAMQLIRPGTLVPGRELIPARTDIPDSPVVVRAVADEREEAEAVAGEIEKLLGGASFHALDSRAVDGRVLMEHQLSFADFAVLYRTSAQAVAVGEALARRGFPFQRRAHSRLAEMPGVPEILAAISLFRADALPLAPVSGPLDSSSGPLDSASRANGCGNEPVMSGPLPQPSGGVAVTELLNGAVRSALAELVTAPVTAEDEAQRSEALAAVKSAADVLGPPAARCGIDLDQFLDEIALGAEVDTWDPRADRITLLTLHAAKGLEFPVVFIVGCDDGLLPLRSWRGAEVDYAEERRLLFVGMTRATTRLTLLTAVKRTLRGEVTECTPSPFLSSIDPALLDRAGGTPAARSRRRARDQQPTLF